MTPESTRTFYDYSYWASERVWECIMRLTDVQFTRDLDYSTGSIRNLVVHMMSAEERWMKRLQGAELTPQPLQHEGFPTREAVKAKWETVKAEVLGYIESLDQAGLDEVVHLEMRHRGVEFSNRRWELLMHVANHATDHRAQILTLLHHHFGVETVEQDMFFFLLEK